MNSRLFFLFANLSLSCFAQLHVSDGQNAPYPALEIQPSITIELPPVSAIVKNGALSLVIDPLPGIANTSEDSKAVRIEGSDSSQTTMNVGKSEDSGAVEPRAVTLPINISDVTGLGAALSQIDASLDSLTTTVTSLSMTVSNLSTTVNALSAQAQNFVSVSAFVDGEIPAGTIDGSNPVFTLSAAPSPPASLALYKNGLRLILGGDYSLSGQTILFASPAVPVPGDVLTATYRN